MQNAAEIWKRRKIRIDGLRGCTCIAVIVAAASSFLVGGSLLLSPAGKG